MVTLTDRLRTFRFPRVRDYLGRIYGACIAVLRRFEEKGKMLFHRKGAKNAKQIKKNNSELLI
jgi:hypothetical protein